MRPTQAYYFRAEVDNAGAMAANVLAAIFTVGICQKAISHHWIVVQFQDTSGKTIYKRYEFAQKSYEGSDWSIASRNLPSVSFKGKSYKYRSASIDKRKYRPEHPPESWVSNYTRNYGDYNARVNNCQHFTKRLWKLL